jgi:hypothetical protein
MAEVVPLDLVKLDVLPLPAIPAEIAWKQYLFYMIAYCDTFHDFAKERKLEGEGRSVSKTDIPDRVGFVMNLINKMDSSIPFNTYLPIINSFRAGTFENNTYAAFTRLLKNPLMNAISDPTIQANIKAYLPTVFSTPANEELLQQDMNERSFQTAVPPINSKVIELYMPAVVYGDTTQDNFISFLKTAYGECLDVDGTLKFVEDTASFPRNIFTTKLANFKKIITTQTRWDPAGLSKFEAATQVAVANVSAPSFRSTQMSTSLQTTFTAESAYFRQATNEIIYPGAKIPITKAGPSVNHLFMHMALEGDDVSAQLKEKFKVMIRAAKNDSKKNMVLPLDATAGTAAAQDVRLRRLTSSKRSGDYENIHSAIHAKALMFTGDEPAFTYAVLNKCPIVFHSCSATGHHFKFYIPPPTDPAAAAAQAATRAVVAAVLKASELQKFFGGADEFYKSFLSNLKEAVFEGMGYGGKVCGSQEAADLLQGYLVRELEKDKEFFNDLVAARTIFRNFGGIALADLKLVDIQKLQSGGITKAITDKLSAIPDLEARNAQLESKLADVRKYIPLKFHQTGDKINAVNGTLFKPNTSGTPFLVLGIKENELKPGWIFKEYKLEPGALFPHFKNMEGNIGGIAKLLNINAKLTNETLKRKNLNAIQGALESLGLEKMPDAEDDSDAIAEAIDNIDRWLASPTAGGYMEVNVPLVKRAVTKRKRNNVPYKLNTTMKRYRNMPTKVLYVNKVETPKNKYLELHTKIASLDASKIPFKLTPQEYADMIVYRLIINDAILEVTPEPEPPEVESNVNMTDPTELQAGGAKMSDAMLSYCMDLFMNHVEPFYRKHIEGVDTSASSSLVSVLRSVVAGSFIQDVELLLNEISSSPEFPSDPNSALYEAMKTTAANNLNAIFNLLDKSYNDARLKVSINEQHKAGSASFKDISDIMNTYSNHLSEINNDKAINSFYDNMNKITTFIKESIIESGPVTKTRGEAQAELDALPDADRTIADKDILQNYVKYALNDYLEVEILGVPTVAPAAIVAPAAEEPTTPVGGPVAKKGGSRSRERKLKHKRGSPRRRSLRRK